MDWTEDSEEADASLARLTADLALEEVYVFTPEGMIVTLPAGATPVDFAYAIHTEVGHSCIGAKIDGRLSALNSKLSTGQTVEVFTSKPVEDAEPSQDWLAFVTTHKARNNIRQWHARQRRLATEATQPDPMPATAKLGADDAATLAEAAAELSEAQFEFPSKLRDMPSQWETERAAARGIQVEGQNDMLVNLAKCCAPVPFDDIIGFVTRGRECLSTARTAPMRCFWPRTSLTAASA